MSILSFNRRYDSNVIEEDVLSVFKKKTTEVQEIKQGMTPSQIAEVVSDRLIEVVKEQFEKVKFDYIENSKK
ncbi:hypothetical protein [Aquiflexum sp.]|uniref:hypothetical protein n=1 Tax=Aquiflexum sp. TaxID=1872584 RepID=UPI003593487B